MKYSTTIALFLGQVSATATTWDDLLNGNCSVDTVTADTNELILTTCSSADECAADADCADADEKCGYFVASDKDDLTTSAQPGKCVYKYACGDVGIRGAGQTWQLLCYDDTEPDEFPNTRTIFDNVENIVNESDLQDWAIGDIENMKIPARDNYQTGRWIRDPTTSKWAETDKPVNNVCTENAACGEGFCCANWPDSNNLRCISSDLAGVEQNLEPFAAFTPACAVNANQAPTWAGDDLASEAQAFAADALTTFAADVLAEAKTKAGYDTMSALEEEDWDDDYAFKQVDVEARDEADRENIGYQFMDAATKAVWDSELLTWKDKVYQACKANPQDIVCLEANEIRDVQETKRENNGYYADMNAEERIAFDESLLGAEDDTMIEELKAAWVIANPSVVGAEGGTCVVEDNSCTDEKHCCGTSTSNDATPVVLTNKCADETTLEWVGNFGVKYTHVCAASKLMAAVTAVLGAAYLM